MAVRDGMATLLDELRSMCAAGTADYTVADVIYWTDQQLQDALDRTRRPVVYELMQTVPDQISGGSVEYHDYYFGGGKIERAESGTAAWKVQDSTGAVLGTANYSIEYDAGKIRVTANTQGTAYYISYRAYDLNRAASTIWRQIAGHVALKYDIQTDNHRLSRSQQRVAALEMAQHYASMSAPQSVTMMRDDFAGGFNAE